MSTPQVAAPTRRLFTMPALRKTIILALLTNVLAYTYAQAVITHHMVPPVVAIEIVTLVVTAVCVTRW